MIEKRGDLTSESHSDFDTRKKVKYVDASSHAVAGEGEKALLASPRPMRSNKSNTPPGYNWPILN